MDAALSDYIVPLLFALALAIFINAGVLWLVMNLILGSRGDGPFWKCLLVAIIMPFAMLIARIFSFAGLYYLIIVFLMGGVAIRIVFDVKKSVSISIFAIYLLTSLAVDFTIDQIGINPAKVAMKTAPTPHKGISKEQYREEMKAALIARLEGEYNVGFDLPDDSTEGLEFWVRPHDGHFKLTGNVDRAYKQTLKTTPAEMVDWVAANVREASKFYSPQDYLISQTMRGPIDASSHDASAPGVEGLPDFYPVPDELAKFLKTQVVQMTPTTDTLTMMKDWQTSGAEGLTSATASAEPTAWELALNAQDLAAYQAAPDPSRTKQEDYRTSSSDSEEARRYITTINETFVTPAGEIELTVEVHREARTAAEDVYGNKIQLPVAGKTKAGIQHIQALLPALTYGGDQYVSLIDEQKLNGPRFFINMEAFVKDVWYRIKFPVQPTAEQTAKFYRLMNMQKLKIARLR